jgi:catechol 2,3-dioxygenase-like lactoylglutathione lyase family enzyme
VGAVVLGFSHVGLVVSDLEKSLHFYCDGVGLKLIERRPDTGRGIEIVFLGTDSGTLELFYYANPQDRERVARGRFDHIAWYVDDIKAAMAKLEAQGAVFRPGDPTAMSGIGIIAITTGPDGERVELVQKQ